MEASPRRVCAAIGIVLACSSSDEAEQEARCPYDFSSGSYRTDFGDPEVDALFAELDRCASFARGVEACSAEDQEALRECDELFVMVSADIAPELDEVQIACLVAALPAVIEELQPAAGRISAACEGAGG